MKYLQPNKFDTSLEQKRVRGDEFGCDISEKHKRVITELLKNVGLTPDVLYREWCIHNDYILTVSTELLAYKVAYAFSHLRAFIVQNLQSGLYEVRCNVPDVFKD